MNLTLILLLPFDLGPGKQNICLKGETQIAGAGGYLPGGFAPQESYFQALLTTVDTLCFSVRVFLFAKMFSAAGAARRNSKIL